MGAFIRLAYADAVEGPWKIYEPDVLPVNDTAFYRPQPDPPENLENFYTHVASPEVFVDDANQRLVLWFHGWWRNAISGGMPQTDWVNRPVPSFRRNSVPLPGVLSPPSRVKTTSSNPSPLTSAMLDTCHHS
jgi:hypothetical protein